MRPIHVIEAEITFRRDLIESNESKMTVLQDAIDADTGVVEELEHELAEAKDDLSSAESVLFGGIPYGMPLTFQPEIPQPEFGASLIGGAL